MNKLILLLVLNITIGCGNNKQQPTNEPIAFNDIESSVMEGPKMTKEPYDLKFRIDQLEDDVYELVVDMLLYNDSFYVSPNAKRYFTGKFTIYIDENDKFEPIDKLIETPLSVEEIDNHPFVRGTINWVRENTTYNQKLKRTAEDNFSVKGFIQFTIEPRCTMEKVPFIIKNYEGEMRIELFGC